MCTEVGRVGEGGGCLAEDVDGESVSSKLAFVMETLGFGEEERPKSLGSKVRML